MTTFGRRQLLEILAASALGAMVPRWRSAFAGTADSQARPRYFVFVYLDGGMDAVSTTDPKRADQVEAGIDVPFVPDAIRTFGPNVVGPHLALLGEHVRELCIVNGVATQALNHVTGARQFLRLRRDAQRLMPTIMSLLGSNRDSQPVAELYVSYRSQDAFAPGFLGSYHAGKAPAATTDFYEVLETTAPDDLRALARTYRGHHQRLGRPGVALEQGMTASYLAGCAKLFERVADTPPLSPLGASSPPGRPPPTEDAQRLAKQFSRVSWILENDLSACVTTTHWNWDSHFDNQPWQSRMSADFFPALGAFVDGLKARHNRHGRLWDQTVVVVASEIGRFPRLNHFRGKDHFPEVPFMLLGGPMRRPGTFGATGKRMEGRPISLVTGAAQPGGDRVTLDDIGATLLSLGGHAPRTYGYTGRPLEFLLG